jgi:hypothetical protein
MRLTVLSLPNATSFRRPRGRPPTSLAAALSLPYEWEPMSGELDQIRLSELAGSPGSLGLCESRI